MSTSEWSKSSRRCRHSSLLVLRGRGRGRGRGEGGEVVAGEGGRGRAGEAGAARAGPGHRRVRGGAVRRCYVTVSLVHTLAAAVLATFVRWKNMTTWNLCSVCFLDTFALVEFFLNTIIIKWKFKITLDTFNLLKEEISKNSQFNLLTHYKSIFVSISIRISISMSMARFMSNIHIYT